MRSPKKPSSSLNFDFNGTIDIGPDLNISSLGTKISKSTGVEYGISEFIIIYYYSLLFIIHYYPEIANFRVIMGSHSSFIPCFLEL